MNWHDYFDYKDGKLYWSVCHGAAHSIGDEAGYVNDQGYRITSVNAQKYRVHRIVWEMHNGKIPEKMEIDHVNHIRTDNRIENLRMVSSLENKRNASMRSDNKSGFTGVSWDKARNKWRVVASVKGGYVMIGRFNDLDDAIKARIEFNESVGFHENHGEKNERNTSMGRDDAS